MATEEKKGEELEDQDLESEEEIKKVGEDTNESIAFYPPPHKKKGPKKIFVIAIVVIILLAGGFLLRNKIKGWLTLSAPTPTPTQTPTPTPTPNPLIRPEWSFEVLNGTSSPGLARKIADKLIALGYPVIKTGNADKDTYTQTEIQVKKDLQSKIDLVIADLKDTVKIASVGGELKEGTASARIIIGKDLNL